MSGRGQGASDGVVLPSPDLNGLGELRGREQLSEVQRARVVAAMTDVASELGVGNATVARVVARSGVSRRTFYELFSDREDCFLAAFEVCVARASRYVLDGYDPQASWIERIRVALTGLLAFLTYERSQGQVLVVETLGAGPRALERRQRVLAQVIAAVDTGRAEVRGDGPPPLTAESVVGGALSLIHSRMTGGEGALLEELAGPLMAMIVLPYLGPAAARRELARPATAARSGAPRVAVGDPLRELDMRLTYRTIRVLLAIGEQDGPGVGSSNRQVADAAGIRDQGQVSKLLARLEHLGLIENAAESRAKGEPNAWTLTRRGEEVRAVVSV
jgi:AcrR family transcriptional regulator